MNKMKFALKTFCILMLAVSLTCTVCSASSEVFGRIGYTDDSLKSIAKESVILRIQNNVYLYDNVEAQFSSNTQVHPFVNDGKICAPVDRILESFGYKVSLDGEKLTAEKDGRTAVFSTGGSGKSAFMRHGFLYASVKDIADSVGMKYYDNGEIGIISQAIDTDKLTEKVQADLSQALAYKWDNINLGALGYVTQIATHPTNKELVYSVTDVGGIYRYNHETGRWIQLLNSAPIKYVGVSAGRTIALDPKDDNIIYVATGNASGDNRGGILKSTDKGETWKRLDMEACCGQINGKDVRFGGDNLIVDPNDSNVLYAASMQEGLWRSDDAGETWRKAGRIPEAVQSLYPLFVYTDGREKTADGKSKVLYMGFFKGGLYKSTDAGESFVKVPGSPEAPMRMKYSDGGYYVSAYGLMDKSVNGGFFRFENGEWTNLAFEQSGIKFPTSGFMVDEDDKNTIFISGAPYTSSGLYRSRDAGQNWEYLGKWNIMADIKQDPLNHDALWAAYAGGVYYISNIHGESVSIEKREAGMEIMVAQKGICLPDQKAPMFLAALMDHGYRAQNTIYDRAPDSLPEVNVCSGIDFCEEDNSFVVRAGLHSTPPNSTSSVTVSNDYGRGFVKMPWNEKLTLCDIAVGATKQANGYPIIMVMSTGIYKESGAGMGIYRSLDGGNTWEIAEAIPVNRPRASWYQIRMLESDRVDGNTFYYMQSDGIYRTRNGGQSWEMVKYFPRTPSYSFCTIRTLPGVEGGVWYTDPDGTINASYDFGETWTAIKTLKLHDVRGWGFGIGKPDTNNPAAYCAGYVDGKFGIWISDDLGKSWRKINIEGEQILSKILDIAGDRKIYGRCFVSTGGRGVIAGWPVSHDETPPVVTLDCKSSSVEKGADYAVNRSSFTLSGTVNEPSEVRVNGQPVAVDGYDKFYYTTELSEGENKFTVEAKDEYGNFCEPQEITVRYTPGYTGIDLDCGTEIKTKQKSVTVTGRTSYPSTVYANGTAIKTDENNKFSYAAAIDGDTKIEVYAVDDSGVRSETKVIDVIYDTVAPVITFDEEVMETERRYKMITGRLSEPGELYVGGKTYRINDDLTFAVKHDVNDGENTVRFQARDTAKNATRPQELKITRKSVDTQNITAKRLPENFVYDGDVSDWELPYWCDKLFYDISDNDARFGLYWDDEYLYVGVDATDSKIVIDEKSRYNSDAVEYYIDGGNEKTVTYDANDRQFCWVPDERFFSLDAYKFKLTDGGYCIEAKFRLADFGINPAAGTVFGFDLDVIDNDALSEIGQRDGCIGFNGDQDNWRSARNFANVTLTD